MQTRVLNKIKESNQVEFQYYHVDIKCLIITIFYVLFVCNCIQLHTNTDTQMLNYRYFFFLISIARKKYEFSTQKHKYYAGCCQTLEG